MPELFDLPVEKMRAGWYTDAYFNHARATLLEDGRHPHVLMQVFQKNDSWLGGMDEAIAILKLCAHDHGRARDPRALRRRPDRAVGDGDDDRRATTPPSRTWRRPISARSRGAR